MKSMGSQNSFDVPVYSLIEDMAKTRSYPETLKRAPEWVRLLVRLIK